MDKLKQNISHNTSTDNSHAGMLRRLFALVYDTLLVIAATFIAFQPVPLVERIIQDFPLVQTLTSLYLVAVWFLFFAWFWTHGGQTVGMKAWRIKLLREDGKNITWVDAMFRFFLSNGCFLVLLLMVGLEAISVQLSLILAGVIFCLAFLWAAFDRRQRALHDLASRTRLIVLNSSKR